MKTCTKCNIEQSISNFNKGNDKDGLRHWCKLCVKNSNKNNNVIPFITEYKCNTCNIIKSIDRFSRNKQKKLGINTQCKECTAIWRNNNRTIYHKYKSNQKLYKLNNKNKVLNNKLIKRYGITFDILNNMLNKQNNKCKICQIEFNNNYNIDHDHNYELKHISKKDSIRGLLCIKCNFLLSKNINIELLENVGKYLLNPTNCNILYSKYKNKTSRELFLKYQNNKCPICKQHITISNKKLVLDHNHSNNLIRGLIHFEENRMIGLCNENIHILNNAIIYLNEYDNKIKELYSCL